MDEAGERDQEAIKAHWEGAWGAFGQSLKPLLDSGEIDICRLIHLIDQHVNDDVITRSVQNRFAEHYGVPSDDDGKPLLMACVINGRYVMAPPSVRGDMALADLVIRQVTDGTKVIVELGCGWGRNLFRIYCRLPGNPIEYVACELTDAGRSAVGRIAKTDKRMTCFPQPFDYRNPDLSFIKGKPDAVFFTSHSIEQITVLGEELFDAILAATGRCRCVHFEPVGWQRDSVLRQWVISGDAGKSKDDYDVGPENVLKNAALWAAGNGYNTNLLEVLGSLEEKGRIRIRLRSYDVIGNNPLNPSTAIVWEKV